MIVVAVILTGCGSSSSGPKFIQKPVMEENPNAAVPLAGLLRFETDEPVRTLVTITDGKHSHQLEFNSTRDSREGLPLVGFRPDREHRIAVTIMNKQGYKTRFSDELRFKTPELPTHPAEFPSIVMKTIKEERMEPGYRLFNPRRRIPRETQLGDQEEREFGANFGMLLMVDRSGIPVWYYRCDSRISDFDYLPNGHITYVTQDFRIVEIDLLGNTVASWYAAKRPQGEGAGTPVETMTFHHDADILPGGDIIALSTDRRKLEDYYTSAYREDAPRKSQWVMGDRIVRFDRDGVINWSWNTFEHLDPYRIGYETFIPYWKRRGYPTTIDWSHANSLVQHPGDGDILVNFRLQSAILKIDEETKEIEWIFGEPSGWPPMLEKKLLLLEDNSRWFWHQHSPIFTSRGTILLFDNGNFRARPFTDPTPVAQTYSRAAEYEINPEKRTAKLVWTSDIPGEQKVVSMAMGSVSELPETGNILVGYGAILDTAGVYDITWETRARIDQWTRAREFTHTIPPEVVWEMQLRKTGQNPGINWNIFGVSLIEELRP